MTLEKTRLEMLKVLNGVNNTVVRRSKVGNLVALKVSGYNPNKKLMSL